MCSRRVEALSSAAFMRDLRETQNRISAYPTLVVRQFRLNYVPINFSVGSLYFSFDKENKSNECETLREDVGRCTTVVPGVGFCPDPDPTYRSWYPSPASAAGSGSRRCSGRRLPN